MAGPVESSRPRSALNQRRSMDIKKENMNFLSVPLKSSCRAEEKGSAECDKTGVWDTRKKKKEKPDNSEKTHVCL